MANKSLNRVVLMGNLTRDPELKYTPQGTAVCTIGLATNRQWTTNTGEVKEEVQFHRIIAWQKLAELCGKLLSKGRKVYIEGRIVYRSYTAKDGSLKQITEIIMNDFILFDDRYTKGIAESGGVTEDHTPAVDTTSNADYSIDEDLDTISPTEPEGNNTPADKTPKVDKVVKEEEKPIVDDDDDIPF